MYGNRLLRKDGRAWVNLQWSVESVVSDRLIMIDCRYIIQR